LSFHSIYYSPSRFHSVFFLRYVDPRDLHSFPTRRSSDLIPREARRELAARSMGFGSDRRGMLARGARELADALDALEAGETSVRDRKSTRLNSSHVKISYAVFCLKKKTKRKTMKTKHDDH